MCWKIQSHLLYSFSFHHTNHNEKRQFDCQQLFTEMVKCATVKCRSMCVFIFSFPSIWTVNILFVFHNWHLQITNSDSMPSNSSTRIPIIIYVNNNWNRAQTVCYSVLSWTTKWANIQRNFLVGCPNFSRDCTHFTGTFNRLWNSFSFFFVRRFHHTNNLIERK